ncbi:Sorting nexin-33 [Aphelenchoides bicaudatus]|nr:Sorting nexin-33 [Aphelenchoides bicaudatus]
MAQVQAAYDFSAQPGSGELSIIEGEVLTVIRDNVDGGWIEGKNAKGKIGLFPEAYVTRLSTTSLPPVAAPPSLPTAFAAHNAPLPKPPSTEFQKPFSPPSHMYAQPPLPSTIGGPNYDPWNDPLPAAPSSAPGPNSQIYPSLGGPTHAPPPDDFDDEWTDDDEDLGGESRSHDQDKLVKGDGNGRPRSQSRGNTSGSRTDLSIAEEDSQYITANEKPNEVGSSSPRPDSSPKDANQRAAVSRSRSAGPDTNSLSKGGSGGGSRLKNINRFSNFVKSGMESFVLATSKLSIQPQEQYEIIITSDGEVRWASPNQNYTCIVDKPKKESKLKGLKSFIAYSVTSSANGIQVSRRYKHFDWLHEQLAAKFLLIPSPPLPEKQVAGRYEEDLIEHRKCILQLWVNKICRHPVLSQCDVWRHFMSCTDEKKWKEGKRKAEKDEFVGGNFFHVVRVPAQPVDPRRMEQQVDNFQRCNRSLDDSVRVLYDRINESQKRLVGPYKSNWQKTAAAFQSLGNSFDIDQSAGSSVGSAIKESASALNRIAQQHEEHGKKDLEQLMDWLYTYKGLLSNIPDILNVHKSALANAQEADSIHQRVDVVSYSLLAEITQLNEERNDDFRQMLGSYFEQQAAFYATIGQQFGQLAQRFKKI